MPKAPKVEVPGCDRPVSRACAAVACCSWPGDVLRPARSLLLLCRPIMLHSLCLLESRLLVLWCRTGRASFRAADFALGRLGRACRVLWRPTALLHKADHFHIDTECESTNTQVCSACFNRQKPSQKHMSGAGALSHGFADQASHDLIND